MYDTFAAVYDELMDNEIYDEWFTWLEEALKRYGNSSMQILDVGCGTGTLLQKLVTGGYKADGVDASSDMLTEAENKIRSLSSPSLLVQQDMRFLDIDKKYHAIVVFCDSLNYLTEEEDVHLAFQSFWKHLDEEGLLLFDVHSLYYVEEILHGFSFAEDRERMAYIWNIFSTARKGEVIQELTFFMERESSMYERFFEIHQQRTFSIHTYEQLLRRANFEILGTYADFTWKPPKKDSDRLFFIAKKSSKVNHFL